MPGFRVGFCYRKLCGDDVADSFIKRQVQNKLVCGQASNVVCFELGKPFRKRWLDGFFSLVFFLFCRSDLGWQELPPRCVGFCWNNDRRTQPVFCVSVFCLLSCVSKVGGKRIIIFRRDRIEFVIVTLTTIRRQAKVNPTKCLHAISRVNGQVLFVDRAAFVGRHVAALESRRDQLFLSWIL